MNSLLLLKIFTQEEQDSLLWCIVNVAFERKIIYNFMLSKSVWVGWLKTFFNFYPEALLRNRNYASYLTLLNIKSDRKAEGYRNILLTAVEFRKAAQNHKSNKNAGFLVHSQNYFGPSLVLCNKNNSSLTEGLLAVICFILY